MEFGFSTVAFANYFDSVVGIDTFEGDIHSYEKPNHYESTRAALEQYSNIHLVQSDYRDWIRSDSSMYDFVHVDIVHTYEDTLRCGLWSAAHSPCVIFHDTESFPAVKDAVLEISRQTGKNFYNYTEAFGLGILV